LKKIMNKRGFTLAELLIVVAIVAVLVAISIPIFTTQLEKAREATDTADARDFYAEIATALVAGDLRADKVSTQVGAGLNATATYNDTTGVLSTVVVSGWSAHQQQASWQGAAPVIAGVAVSSDSNWKGAKTITYTFTTGTDGDVYLSGVSAAA